MNESGNENDKVNQKLNDDKEVEQARDKGKDVENDEKQNPGNYALPKDMSKGDDNPE